MLGRGNHAWRPRLLSAVLSLACLLCLGWAAGAAASPGGHRAEITRTAYGIPHIRATTWAGLGYGTGYAYAQDNLCTIADTFVTVRAQRSRFFGPGKFTIASAKPSDKNLDSDFFWKSMIDRHVVEKLLARKPPLGPKPPVKAAIRGWAAGYDAYLNKVGVANIPDPRCRGKAWVKPIQPIDVWRRVYQLSLIASSGNFIGGLVAAEPPAAATPRPAAPTQANASRAARWWQRAVRREQPIGSNAIGLGSEATRSGDGMLLANPHFPWIGPERFYQFQLTLLGKVDVQGSSLGGLPVVNIGFNRHVAWSHTVSTAWRFTPFQLQLVPGKPTSYVLDGKTRKMTSRTVRVKTKTANGLQTRRHTFWYSRLGPILDLPQAFYTWNADNAYALGDANADNLRIANVWFDIDRARSVGDLVRAQSRDQGVPWVNTIAADDRGRALYQDNSVVPHVTKAKIDTCIPAGLPKLVYQLAGLITLDGTKSSCGWGTDADAVRPGIFGPHHLPILRRRDFVQNSNDSYWYTNPEHPLTGFSPVIGTEGTELGLRTRYGIRLIRQRLAGSDGLPGKRFTLGALRRLWQRDDSEAGILLKDQLADLCEAHQMVTLPDTSVVDVSAACPVIRNWNANARLDSKGAWLFAVWWGNSGNKFSDPFDPAHPLSTPNQLDPNADNIQALGLAVKSLEDAGLPLDATMRQAQYFADKGRRIPIPGCDSGCYVDIYGSSNPAVDSDAQGVPVRYGQVIYGSSTVMQIELTPQGPRGKTILTYSESENPRSPHHADQTRLYSKRKWIPLTFTAKQIRRAAVRRYVVGGH